MAPHVRQISVIIPTCNRNDLLARCLDCLAPGVQSLSAARYGVVVTDDGSHATAEEMVRTRYPWACWVAGPRRGPAANRNNGARAAAAEWLAFTDDDCLPKPGWLEALLLATAEGAPVYEGRTTCEAGVTSPLLQAPTNETGGYLWSCNMMVRNATFQELGGFDEAFPHAAMEDVDFRERLTARGHRFTFVRDAVVDHPPRRRSAPSRIAASHECFVIHSYKRGRPVSPLPAHLLAHVRFETGRIRSAPFSRDTLTAFRDLLLETLLIASQMGKWKKKHLALKTASAPT